MPRVLHEIERRIVGCLGAGPMGQDELAGASGLSIDQVRRGTEWLRHKGLVRVERSYEHRLRLGKNGLDALERGLPERRLLDMLSGGPRSVEALRAGLGPDFGPAMGYARKALCVEPAPSGQVRSTGRIRLLPGEALIKAIGRGEKREREASPDAELLAGRPGYITRERVAAVTLELTGEGMGAAPGGPEGAIDVEADAPPAYAARTHPLRDVMGEVREAFVALGFSEIRGSLAQPSFWNFDALFTPQDHPAREMQDTFYIEGARAPPRTGAPHAAAVAREHGRHWGYRWDPAESRRMVLRTHTTCVTVRHLAGSSGEERVFSLGRVFRNEKPSYKHLAEFHQIEGVVAGRRPTLRELMGIQREFYRRMGLPRVRFWPTFFPYTEPSLQTMVHDEKAGRWVELFGMGMLRPEVTRPLGISRRVLAWGGGIERIAMLRRGAGDVREFYANGLGWLRGPRCR